MRTIEKFEIIESTKLALIQNNARQLHYGFMNEPRPSDSLKTVGVTNQSAGPAEVWRLNLSYKQISLSSAPFLYIILTISLPLSRARARACVRVCDSTAA